MVGPCLLQHAAEWSGSERTLSEDPSPESRDLVEVESRGALPPSALEAPLDDRLNERPELEAVPCGDEVDRRAHHRDPNDGSVDEESGQLRGIEPLEPAPEADVGARRQLCLQTDECLDRVEDRALRPAQEHLPVEQRPVTGATVERGHHAAIMTTRS